VRGKFPGFPPTNTPCILGAGTSNTRSNQGQSSSPYTTNLWQTYPLSKSVFDIDVWCITFLHFTSAVCEVNGFRCQAFLRCCSHVVRPSQKNFAPPQTGFPGAQDGQNLTSWRWSQTQFGEDRCTQFRVIVVTDPHTNKPTDRTDYTAPRSLARSVVDVSPLFKSNQKGRFETRRRTQQAGDL